MTDVHGQRDHAVRFDWGPTGAARTASGGGVLVVVDVLSFTTTVGVAVERGTVVHPAPWRDERAAELARRTQSVLAVGRRAATPDHPWSLSPAGLRAAAYTPRLVLPSPNGSSIAYAAAEVPGLDVVAASLRNAAAVGRWLRDAVARSPRPVTVVAAGERWPDGSLRPALEDALGAGAVLAALDADDLSPEAAAARAQHDGTADVPDAVRRSASGRELVEAGFAADLEVAVEVGTCEVVPLLVDGAFRDARA